MALLCPNVNDANWKLLVSKVGETAAYRAFYRNAHLPDPVSEALSKFDISKYTIEKKSGDLQSTAEKVVKVDSVDPTTGEAIHEYRTTSGKLLESVSRILDRNEDTKYRGGESVGSKYADKGTSIHKVFEMAINDVSSENILTYMQSQGIPDSFLTYVNHTINHLRTKGKVLSEQALADLDVGIAGTGDIPVLLYDGSIELYDIKTAHQTSASKEKIWNPVNDYNGYKSRRYPTQLEFYARMIERTLGQPVSKKYILPIEITYKDADPSKGFDTITPLPYEDVDSYGNKELADKIVSDFFGDNKPNAELPALATIDDSDDLIRNITGRIEGRETDLDAEADIILSKSEYHKRLNGSLYYYNPIQKQFVRLKDQSNKTIQKRQIIDEYLSKIDNSRSNIVESMKNYLFTGKDAYLDTISPATKNIKAILDIYKGRKDITINKLSDIKGFETKKNWILITDGDPKQGGAYDLIYTGNDVLNETLNVARNNRKGNTLFAKYMSNSQAKMLLGSSLQNNVADAKKFEGALIAIKLKESSPEAAFKRITITSTNKQNQKPEDADLWKLLPIVEKFGKMKQDLIPANMKSTFNNSSLFDPKQYQQNALEGYKRFITVNLNARAKRLLDADYIAAYDKEKDGWQDLIDKALEDAKSIQEAGLDNDPLVREELRLLVNIKYYLEGIGTELYPISWKSKTVSMPQNIPNQVIQDLVKRVGDALRRVTNTFWDSYKKPTQSYFDKLFSPFYKPSGVRDAILSDTDRYYEPLLEKTTAKVITGVDEQGNSLVENRDITTYNLIQEGSDAFNALSDAQKDFIKMFNDRVQEAMANLGIEWERGRMPLVPASYRNQLYKAYQLGTNATLQHYTNSLRKMFDDIETSFIDTIKGDDEFSVAHNNIFIRQANGRGFDGRADMIGIGKDGFVNPDSHGKWETNLELVLDLTMMTAYRTAEMDRLNNVFLAAKSHFDWQKSNLFEERVSNNINMVDAYRTAIIYNKDIDSGTIQNKTVRTLNKVTSTVKLGFNPGVALLSAVGAQATAMSEAVANSFAGNGKYSVGNWAKAGLIVANPTNYKKVTALLEQYKLYDLDMSSLLNGRRRYGDRSIFKMKWMYGMLNAGDWLSRSQIMVAQMIQDGSWDAHSMDGDKLVYDESKDKRFEDENGKLLKTTIKANLEKEGLVEDGKLTRAYDFNLTKSIKGQIDMVIGGFDRETRGMYNFNAMGKLFGLFKTYMPSRIDKLTSAPFQSQIIGKYELVEDADGKKQYIWKGDQVEGIFHSMNVGMFYLRNLNSEHNVELTDVQKQNLSRLAGDFLFMGFFSLLAYAIADDDKKTQYDDLSAFALQGAVRDLLAFYNVFSYLEFISTPVSVGFLQKTAKRIYNITMKASDPESDTLVDSISLLPAAKQYTEIADYLYDQPTE